MVIMIMVREGMLGDYACTASNKHGTSSATIQVIRMVMMVLNMMMVIFENNNNTELIFGGTAGTGGRVKILSTA